MHAMNATAERKIDEDVKKVSPETWVAGASIVVREQLITENLERALSVALMFRPRTGLTRDDLKQEAAVALVAAVDAFLCGDVSDLRGLIFTMAWNRLWKVARTAARHPHHGSRCVDIDTYREDLR